jgi:hypothetical protein
VRPLSYGYGMPEQDPRSPTQALLSVVADVFEPTGNWPTRQYVRATLDQDHGLDLEEVLEVSPRSLVYSAGTQEGSEVVLTVAGLVAGGDEEDARRFIEALRWCVAEQIGFRPADPAVPEDLSLHADQFKSEWASRGERVGALELGKLRVMLGGEGIYSSIGGDGEEWTVTLDWKSVRPYREVETIEDYLAIKDPPAERTPTPPAAPKPAVGEAATADRSDRGSRKHPPARRTTVTGSTAERHWRRLYVELGELLEGRLSLQEVADLFYEYGVTETPDLPDEVSSVREYTIDTLHNRLPITGFLRHGLPKTVLDLDLDGADVEAISTQMETLGYGLEETARDAGVASYLPPKRLPRTPMPISRAMRFGRQRVSTTALPNDLKELVEELNDNLARENQNAAALLIRKIISQAVYVAMARRGKADELKKENGDDLDLAAALRRCKEVCQLSAQVMGRVTSAKWIGDTANHSYRAKVSAEEVERAVTGLSLFLKEVL